MTENWIEDLEALLARHGIDTTLFGRGEAKSLDHLRKEIAERECELGERDGQLVRRLAVVNVDVFADRPDGRWHLVEKRQEFADGRPRCRDYLSTSVSEKMFFGEDVPAAVTRALSEELGVSAFTIIFSAEEEIDTRASPSFPGLISEYSIVRVSVLIDPVEFRNEYREKQADKTTIFVWELT